MALTNLEILKVTYEAVISATDTIFQNVYYLQFHTIGSRGDTIVLDDIETWLEDVYGEIDQDINEGVLQSLCSVDVIEWDSQDNEWVTARNVGLVNPTLTFTDINPRLPQQSAPFALFKTARPKSMGKKFLCGYTEETSNGGLLLALALQSLAGYASEVLNGISIDLDTFYITGVPRTGFDVWLPFTLAVVTDLIRTQRRRVPGVGA